MQRRPAAYAVIAPLFAFVFGIGPASAQSGGVPPGQAGLNYEVYAGGLHVKEALLRLEGAIL